MHPRSALQRTTVLGGLAALGLAGCFFDSSDSGDGSRDPSRSSASNSAAALAFQQVFRDVDSEGTDPGAPLGENADDLVSANRDLRSAYRDDPDNSQAAFGLAATSLALRMNALAGTFERMDREGLVFGENSSEPLAASPQEMTASFPALARAISDPARSPRISEIQDSLEFLLLPTLDSAVDLLGKAWNDPTFELKIPLTDIFEEDFSGDSLVIDRSDVGLAYAAARTFRATVRWMIAYNLDVDKNGSYRWLEAMDTMPVAGPSTPNEIAAVDHLKSLLDPSSSFLRVRTGKSTLLGSVPGEVKAALQTAREAAHVGYTLKAGREDHIPTFSTTGRRDDFVAGVDTAIALLSGPRTFLLTRKTECKDSSWSVQDWGYGPRISSYSYIGTRISLFGILDECSDNYDEVYGDGYQYHQREIPLRTMTTHVKVDLAKLMTLSDLKVFMPKYRWNAYGTWEENGPFSLVGPTGTATTVTAFDEYVELHGLQNAGNLITWADPSFGGAFPDFRSSSNILQTLARGFADDYYPTATGSAVAALPRF